MSVATTPPLPRMRAASIGILVAGLVAAAIAQMAGPEDGPPAILATAADLLALGTLLWFVVARRPASRFPWVLLIASLLVTPLAEMAIRSDLTTSAAAIELLHIASLVGYAVTVASFALIATSLGVLRDRSAMIDGLIVAAAAASIAWALVEGPVASGFRYTESVDLSFLLRPLLGTILTAITVALLFRIGRASPAILLVVGAALCQLFVDTIGAAAEAHVVPGLPLGVIPLGILSSACLAAALVDPSATLLVRERPTGVPFAMRTRIAVLAGAAIASSLVAIFGVLIGESLLISAMTDLLAGLIVILFAVRIWLLTGALVRTQAELARSSSFLQGIAEAMPGAIIAGDLTTLTADWASPGLATLLGWPLGDVVGHAGWITGHMHPDDVETFVGRNREAVADGRPQESFQFRLQRSDGKYVTLASTIRYQGAPGATPDRFVVATIDITDQAETRQRLVESERFIADIARASRAMLIAGRAGPDQVGHFDFVSPSVRDILGYAPEDVVATPGFFRSILHPDDRSMLDDAFDAVARGETTVEGVRRYRSAAGAYRSLLLSASMEPGPHGTLRFVYSGIDVTERVQLEDELREARELSETIIATTPGMIFTGTLVPPEITYASPGITPMLGYAPEEVVGTGGWFREHMHPDDRDGHLAALEAALRAGGGVVTRTIRLESAHAGGYRSLLYTARIEADGSYVASGMDVTETVAAEKELERSRRLLSDIVETNPGMIFSGRIAPRVIDFVSPGVQSLLGYSPEEIVGVDDWIPDHMHPDDFVAHTEMIKRLVADRGGDSTTETRIRAADGSWRNMLVSLRLSIDPGTGPVYFASAIDVTAAEAGGGRAPAVARLRREPPHDEPRASSSRDRRATGVAGVREPERGTPPRVPRRRDRRHAGWMTDHVHPRIARGWPPRSRPRRRTPGEPPRRRSGSADGDRRYRPLVISVLAFVARGRRHARSSRPGSTSVRACGWRRRRGRRARSSRASSPRPRA